MVATILVHVLPKIQRDSTFPGVGELLFVLKGEGDIHLTRVIKSMGKHVLFNGKTHTIVVLCMHVHYCACIT